MQAVVMLGEVSPSMAIDMNIFYFDGKQMAVVAGGGGDVSLHNLDLLPEVFTGNKGESELGPIDTWEMRDQPFDKRKTFITGILVRKETVNSKLVTRVYAATNTDGVYILEVRKAGSSYILVEIQRLNTIFQALSLSFEKIAGEDVLVVYDHGGGMSAFISP